MKIISWLKTAGVIFLATFLVWLAADQAIRVLMPSLVFPDHYKQQNDQRLAWPYIAFKGAPNKLDHDSWGYRWVPKQLDEQAVKIAFFGGSTGYNGTPPIASMLEAELTKRTGRKVQVANFSVVSSNHRQHLHNIIESRSIFVPDIVVFYGGYNETVQSAFYDPRPGFPYSFYFRNETSPLLQVLMEDSPTVYLIERGLQKRGKSLTPLGELRVREKPLTEGWNQRIIKKYFETLELAMGVTGGFEAPVCGGKGQFFAFYQPYQVPTKFEAAHEEIRGETRKYKYIFDVSDAYRKMGKEIFSDIVHVKQPAREEMARRIADVLIQQGALGRACAKAGKPAKHRAY